MATYDNSPQSDVPVCAQPVVGLTDQTLINDDVWAADLLTPGELPSTSEAYTALDESQVNFVRVPLMADFTPLVGNSAYLPRNVSRDHIKAVYSRLTFLIRNDSFMQEVLHKFLLSSDNIIPTLSGVTKRSNFVSAHNYFYGPSYVRDHHDHTLSMFADSSPMAEHSNFVFVHSYLYALTKNLKAYDHSDEQDAAFRMLIFRLNTLYTFIPKLTPLGKLTKEVFFAYISFNTTARLYSMIIRRWLKQATATNSARTRSNYSLAQSTNCFDMLSRCDSFGLFDMPFGTVNEYGSAAFVQAYTSYFMEAHNQGLGDFISNLGTTAANAARASSTAVDIADQTKEMLENVRKSTEQNAEAIQGLKSTANAVKEITDYINQCLEPFKKAGSAVSDIYGKITDAIKVFWDLCAKFPYVSLPIAYTILAITLRHFLPLQLWSMFETMINLLGMVVYGTSAMVGFSELVSHVRLTAWNLSVPNTPPAHRRVVRNVVSTTQQLPLSSTDNYFTDAELRRGKGERRPNYGTDLSSEFAQQIGFAHTVADLFEGEPDVPPLDNPALNALGALVEETESDDDAPPMVVTPQAAPDVIAAVASFYVFLGVDIRKKDQLIEALKAVPPVSKGAQAIFNSLVDVFYFISDNVVKIPGLENSMAQLLDSRFVEWKKRCDEVISNDKAATFTCTEEGIAKMESVIEHGMILMAAFQATRQTALVNLISRFIVSAQNCLHKAKAMQITGPRNRPEPVCCAFTGPPGHGKTVAAKLIAYACVEHELKDDPDALKNFYENQASYICYQSQEHWKEGYNPQTLVNVHEEWPVAIEDDAATSPYVDFIDEINVTSRPLPMANADQKGKIFYNHPYTLITTNSTHFKSNFVTEQGAIRRRIPICVYLTSKNGTPLANQTKELNPDNILMELCYISDDGLNTVVPMGVNITLKSLAHVIITMREFRREQAKRDSRSLHALSKDFAQSVEQTLWSDARYEFEMVNRRKPTTAELITFITENYDDYQDYNLEAIGIRKPIPSGEFAAPVPRTYGSTLGRHSEEIGAPGGFVVESQMMSAMAAVNAINPPNPQEIAPRPFSLTVKKEEALRMIMATNPNRHQRILLECLGTYIEGVLVTSNARTVGGNDIAGGSAGTSIDYVLQSKRWDNYEYRLDLHFWVTSAIQELGGHFKMETIMSMLIAFGKYRLCGFPVPSLSISTTENYSVLLHNKATNQLNEVSLSHDSPSPWTRAQRAFLHVGRALGLSHYLGVTPSDTATFAFSSTEYVVKTLVESFRATQEQAMAFLSYLVLVKSTFQEYKKGSITAVEARSKLTNWFAVPVTDSFAKAKEAVFEAWEEAKTKIWGVCSKLLVFMESHAVPIIAALGSLAVAWAVSGWPYTSTFFGVTPQDSGAKMTKWSKSRVRKPNFDGSKGGGIRQGASESGRMGAWINDVLPKIRKNTYEVLSPSGLVRGFATALELRRFIMPSHFFVRMAAETQPGDVFLRIRRLLDGTVYEFRESEIAIVLDLEEYSKDLVCYDICSNVLPLHADIKCHFADALKTRHSLHSGLSRVTLVTFGKETNRVATSDIVYIDRTPVRIEEAQANMMAKVYLADGTPRVDCINYDIPTLQGDCGALLFKGDKIIGMHATGNGRFGQSTIVDLGLMTQIFEAVPEPVGEPDLKFTDFQVEKVTNRVLQILDPDAHSGPVVALMEPATSTFVKDDFSRWNPAGPLIPTVEPVNCSVENYSQARAKYRLSTYDIDQELFDLAEKIYGDFLLAGPHAERITHVLTLREAICGIPGRIDPMDHQTSPGFPHCMVPGGRSTIYNVDSNGNLTFGKRFSEVISYVKRLVECMSGGDTPGFVYKDSLKSELRKPEKKNSPRLILGAQFEHTLISKCYMAGFFDFVTHTNFYNDSFIGIDPHTNWDPMERRFREVGSDTRNMTGDYSGYDNHVLASFVEVFARIANRYYGVANDSPEGRVRIQIARTCVDSYHSFGPVLELWEVGFCSGAYCTAQFNTMRNSFMELYSFMYTARELGKPYEELGRMFFTSGAFMKAMGDDKRLAVSEAFSFHNNVTHAKVVQKAFGLKYTDAKKTGNLVPFDPPSDLSLVKRDAVYCEEDGKYYGALDLATIINMVCWTKGEEKLENIRNRADNAIRELSFHPAHVWNEYAPLIEKQVGNLWRLPYATQRETREAALHGWSA